MAIRTETWTKLSESLCHVDFVSLECLIQNKWKAVIFDDNNFDFGALEGALETLGITKYYVVPIDDISLPPTSRRILEIKTGSRGWQPFFQFDADGFSMCLEDCVLFSSPIKFIVVRTGHVRHTIYAGPEHFVQRATGIWSLESPVSLLGDHWPDGRVIEYYR